jgi:phage shock protein B
MMTAATIVAIACAGILLALATVCGTVLLAMKMRQGGLTRAGREAQAEETRLIQDLHRGMARLESRVDALETLLLERQPKETRP